MWVVVPFLLQMVAMVVDEFYYHHKRGLPKWERIGHPVDTFSVFLCIVYVLFFSYSKSHIGIYSLLAISSCLIVTKDEFVHKEHCEGSESLLHAFLFILHPITLFMVYLAWPLLNDSLALKSFFYLQATATFLFFVYQIVYWNFVWKEKKL